MRRYEISTFVACNIVFIATAQFFDILQEILDGFYYLWVKK